MKRALDWREVLVINFFKKNWLIILLVSLIFGVGVSFGYDKLNQTTYESSGQLVQNDNNSGIVSSYKQFIASSLFKANMKKKSTKVVGKIIVRKTLIQFRFHTVIIHHSLKLARLVQMHVIRDI